jgi:hypothetical protein
MRKAIFATLAVLGVSLAASSLSFAAPANTNPYPQTQYEGNNN